MAIHYNNLYQQDIVVNIISIIGYMPTAIAAAVYSYQLVSSIVDGQSYNADVSSNINNYVLPIAFTSVSSINFD